MNNIFGWPRRDNVHPEDYQGQFAVWAPGLRDSPITNTAFNLYAMSIEEEREKRKNEDENPYW